MTEIEWWKIMAENQAKEKKEKREERKRRMTKQ